jgi:hypothetical protein
VFLLIRDGQISRAEAISRITEENKHSLDALRVCCDKTGIDISEIKSIVDKYGKIRWLDCVAGNAPAEEMVQKRMAS